MITIWPQYLDKKLTLSEGRKISKENAVSSPTIEEIERSLKRLGYTYEVQKKIA
ncbi:MAG: signal recognition particle subunit SRP19/SEC65 family protein, partial [Methanobrevibacter sp.]|nr:signal recognition particle subunit SRP19/SEC65 family protein [Methanobrevibacter sp.]